MVLQQEEIKLLNFYLSQITVGYFDRHEVPPKSLDDYEPFVIRMEVLARNRGESEILVWLLTRTLQVYGFNFSLISGGRYPFTDEEVERIARYTLAFLTS